MRNWKRLGIFALLGIVLSWMASCASPPQRSPSSSTAGETQEVEFWTMQLSDYTDYFNTLIANFETENPGVTVRWTDVPWGDMQSKILTAVSANTAPDVVNLNPDFAAQLAGRNAWMPLDDHITPEQQAQYLPKIWEANKIDGQSFGIPWYLATSILVSNTDLLNQAGVSTPPATFEELAAVAEQVKAETGKYAFFITFVPEDSAEVLQSMVQMGVELVDSEGRAAFNTPAGKAAFEYWVDLYQRELLPQEVLTQGHRRGIDLYQAGETALLSTGPQFLNTIATNAPSIAAVSASSAQLTGETGKKNVAVMNLVIPQNTDQPEAALQFALYVTNAENQLEFAKLANVLPSTTASLEDSHFTTTTDDTNPAEKARITSAAQMTDAEVLLPTISDIKELQKIVYTNLQAAMLGQITVDEAIAIAEETWNNR